MKRFKLQFYYFKNKVVVNGHTRTLALVAFGVLVSLFAFVSQNISYTVSYFYDFEISKANVVSATALDFSISEDGSVQAYIGAEDGGGVVVIPVVTPTPETYNLKYRVFAEKQSGNDALCNAIQATATTSPFVYSGLLLSISTDATTTIGQWPLALSLPQDLPGVAHGDVCHVDLVYRGWVDGTLEGEGYDDEERVHLSLYARMIVINEFLPNPEGLEYGFDFGTDSSNMPQGEWVELYNTSDSAINLAGWYVWDGSGSNVNKVLITASNTLTATTTIPAGGFLVVYMNKAILNNGGDEVRLYNGADELVDVVSYADHEFCKLEPTPGSINDTAGVVGVCVDIPPNKSYARIPDGFGPVIDPVPTPGFSNTLEPLPLEQSEVSTDVTTSTDIVLTEGEILGATTSTATTTDSEPIKETEIEEEVYVPQITGGITPLPEEETAPPEEETASTTPPVDIETTPETPLVPDGEETTVPLEETEVIEETQTGSDIPSTDEETDVATEAETEESDPSFISSSNVPLIVSEDTEAPVEITEPETVGEETTYDLVVPPPSEPEPVIEPEPIPEPTSTPEPTSETP